MKKKSSPEVIISSRLQKKNKESWVELSQALLAWPYLQEVLLKLISNSNKF